MFSSVLNSVDDTLVGCQLKTVEIIQSLFSSFHLLCSVIMEDSTDIELYEEIVGSPAYSSSSDTSKSDPVSFQFKEPRLTEYREEDFFARARSRPDPRIISYALAGKNSQEPRSCNTFVECASSRREFYDNSTILAPTSNTSIFDTFATVAPDVEPTHGTSVYAISVRYWRPTWGQRQTFPYSTSLR